MSNYNTQYGGSGGGGGGGGYQPPPPPGWNPPPQGTYPPPPPQSGYAPPPGGYAPPPGAYSSQPPYPAPGGYNTGYGTAPPPPPGYNPSGGYGGPGVIGENDPVLKDYGLAFDDKTIRRGFIRKVFAIIAIQLVVVTALIAAFLFPRDVKYWVQRNSWIYWVSYAVFLVTYIALACCQGVRRRFPANIMCLALLTLAIGYMTAMISSFYDVPIVLIAMGICAGCSFAIILFASQTRFDFTKWIGVMFVVFIVIFLFGIIAIIVAMTTQVKVLYVVYAGLMALVFMVYLAIDVQMIMGGKKYEINPEDYVFAAAQIFLDIIYIFWFMLQIAGFASNR